MAITRIDPWVGGLGIDATGKFEVASNATVTVGNGASTGNVNVGGEVVSSTVDATTLKLGGTAVTSTAAELNYTDGVTSNIQTQLDGKQASGSYLTGNQTITLSGDASGSGTTAITVTVADDSHNHIISNVDGLQAALDGKQASGSYLTGNQTITLSGDVSGSGTTAITVTVADDSHNHIISNVDGLQTALDAKLASSSYTAADVLTKIKTVDGSGSGLDADLLDGISSASFLRSDADDATTGTLTVGGNLLPDTDNTGVVGNATYTWNNGQFTNLTVDSTLNVRGYIDLADSDGIRFGSSDDARYFYNGTSNLLNIEMEAACVGFTWTNNTTELARLTKSTGDFNLTTGKWQEGGNDLIPAGSIIMYGAASAPGGWYLCEGGAISRSTYAALFSAIGTTYGVGDGSTTFNVPDFRDRAPYGASTFTLGSKTAGEVNASGQNSTGTGTTGSTGGSTVANTTGSGGPTTHSVTTAATNSTTDKDVSAAINAVTAVNNHAAHTHSIPSLTVNGHTHSVPALTVTHPGVAVKFIIKT